MIYKNKEGDFITVKFSKRKGKFVIPNKIMDYELYIIESRDFIHWDELTEIIIPGSVTSIKEWTFSGCYSLEDISIPEGVTNIGALAFYDCSSLTNINIPEGMTSIGYGVFYDCSGLTNINIPAGVTNIGIKAFFNCTNLDVAINNSKNNVVVGEDAFEGCKSVTWLKE